MSADELRRSFDELFAQAATAHDEATLALLTAHVAGQRLAFRVDQMAGLAKGRRLLRLPGAPPRLLGLVGLRGRVVPVFSLSALLGPTKDPEEPWLVLTGGDEPIGVAVAHLEGHLNVPRASLLTAPGGDARSIHVREHVRDGAVTRGIVDLVTLAGEIQKHQGPAGPGKER